jgi:hypothetical protein
VVKSPHCAWLLVGVLVGVLPACGSDHSCKTALADRIGSDGAALDRALAEHMPTYQEQEVAAVFWVFMIVAHETGELSPVFVQSHIEQPLQDMTAQYPSFFTACGAATASSAITTQSTSSEGDYFDCSRPCYSNWQLVKPASIVASQLLELGVGEALKHAPVRTWLGLAQRISKALATRNAEVTGKVTSALFDGLMSADEVKDTLYWIGLGVAAVAIGATLAEFATAALIAGLIGTLISGISFGKELAKIYVNDQTCWNVHQRIGCADSVPPNQRHLYISGPSTPVIDNMSTLTIQIPYDASFPSIGFDGGIGPVGDMASTPCSSLTTAGGDAPETHTIELGKRSGSFLFSWDMFQIPDAMTVSYQGTNLFSTGCTSGGSSTNLSYSGTSTTVTVAVSPNCQGGTSGTAWQFTVGCP